MSCIYSSAIVSFRTSCKRAHTSEQKSFETGQAGSRGCPPPPARAASKFTKDITANATSFKGHSPFLSSATSSSPTGETSDRFSQHSRHSRPPSLITSIYSQSSFGIRPRLLTNFLRFGDDGVLRPLAVPSTSPYNINWNSAPTSQNATQYDCR